MPTTIAEAGAALRRGELTPVDLLERSLRRIDELEPRIRAWVLVDRDRATADALRMGEEMKRGVDRGPLHGIPVGVKDIFDVEDWPTAAGSKRWADSIARQDSAAVARWRQAGAVMIGKTVTVAYAAFDPSVTRNPWNADRTPGGSSSGSAAAVACGMCFGALGSQTGGSITRPSSYCGVYGLKPSFGEISLEGVVPFAPSFDHGGVIGGSVGDLVAIYQTLGRSTPTGEVRRVLGLPGGFFESKAEPVMARTLSALIDRLRAAGWTVVPTPLPAGVADVPRNHRLIVSVEALAYHVLRWQRYPEEYGPLLTKLLVEAKEISGAETVETYRHHRDLGREASERFPEIDAYLAPATEGPPGDTSHTGTPLFQAPWSYMRLPTVSMPFAWTEDGLPLCLQIAGRPNQESQLLGVAKRLEADVAFTKREVT